MKKSDGERLHHKKERWGKEFTMRNKAMEWEFTMQERVMGCELTMRKRAMW